MKLYLDEMIDPDVATALRERGHDVVHVSDRAARAAPDTAQLARAIHERRAIATRDIGDFVSLAQAAASARRDHWGIVLVHERALPSPDLGRLIRALDAVLREHPEEDALKDQVIYLQPAPEDRTP